MAVLQLEELPWTYRIHLPIFLICSDSDRLLSFLMISVSLSEFIFLLLMSHLLFFGLVHFPILYESFLHCLIIVTLCTKVPETRFVDKLVAFGGGGLRSFLTVLPVDLKHNLILPLLVLKLPAEEHVNSSLFHLLCFLSENRPASDFPHNLSFLL